MFRTNINGLTWMRECFIRLCEYCLPQMDRTGIKENGALFPAEKESQTRLVDWPEMEACVNVFGKKF